MAMKRVPFIRRVRRVQHPATHPAHDRCAGEHRRKDFDHHGNPIPLMPGHRQLCAFQRVLAGIGGGHAIFVHQPVVGDRLAQRLGGEDLGRGHRAGGDVQVNRLLLAGGRGVGDGVGAQHLALRSRYGHAGVHVTHGHAEHVVLRGQIGVEAGGAVVAAVPDADVADAGCLGLAHRQFHRAVGHRRRHDVVRIHDGPRRPLRDDLFVRGRAQAARAHVLQQPAQLARAVGESCQRVGRHQHLGGEPGVFFVEAGYAHRLDAESGQICWRDPRT